VSALVIGVGNADRGDDAVGLVVARGLLARNLAGVDVRECVGEATALIDAFAASPEVFIIDAAQLGEPAGTVRRFDAAAEVLPQTISDCSSHSFGVAQGVELARALQTLPARCVLYAVQGEHYLEGQPLSAAVREAAVEVERCIAEELQRGGA
jgi:hydrogenase maturation protease